MEHVSPSERIRHVRPRNTRPQDLLLAIKGQYASPDTVPMAEQVRRVVAAHNGVPLERMSWKDTAYVLLGDLLPVLRQEIDRDHQFIQFMMDLAPRRDRGEVIELDDDYYAVLVDRVATRLLLSKVRDDNGNSLLPFAIPAPDAAVAALLAA